MFIPIVHQGRCTVRARSESQAVKQAQKALQHAMWTLSASTSAYHLTLRDLLYSRTKQALEDLDHRDSVSDPDTISVEVVQAWLLLAVYEFKCVDFRRAWVSAGRAFRLIQLDTEWTASAGQVTNSGTSPGTPKWIGAEERRRTFWFAYCMDRLTSLRNGSTPTFSEQVRIHHNSSWFFLESRQSACDF